MGIIGTIDQSPERIKRRLILRVMAGWVLSLATAAGVGVAAGDAAGLEVGAASAGVGLVVLALVGRWVEARPRHSDIPAPVPAVPLPSLRFAGHGHLEVPVEGVAVQAAVGVTNGGGGTLPAHVAVAIVAGSSILIADRGRSGAIVHAALPEHIGRVIVDTDNPDLSWVMILRGVVASRSPGAAPADGLPEFTMTPTLRVG